MTPQYSLPASSTATFSLWRDLAPVCVIVFSVFLAIGLPMPIIAYHLNDTLGYGAFVVGLVIGAQSWATLLTRHGAGTRSDLWGPRNAVAWGLGISVFAGTLNVLSVFFSGNTVALTVLFAGRIVLGIGESLVVTGALSWGITLVGRERSGVVMSWVGIAMYGAIAVGAPLGSALYSRSGFFGVASAITLAPLLGVFGLFGVRNVPTVGGMRIPFYRVIRMIWLPGLGLVLGAVGFGAIAAYSFLLFRERNWPHAAFAMTAFGTTYVLARVFFGGLPDRWGGTRTAMVASTLAAIGQFGLWFAGSAVVATTAAACTGLGFALIFPSFGVEAMRNVPPQNRGAALGAYSACFDVSLGLGVPLLGLAVGLAGTGIAFAIGAFGALASLSVAVFLDRNKKRISV